MPAEQLELFKTLRGDSGFRENQKKGFFSFARPYEKPILLTIVILIITVVAYCLGIERGKGIALQGAPSLANPKEKLTVRQTDSISTEKDSGPEAVNLKQKNIDVAQNQQGPYADKKEDNQYYTIQVATYNTNALAQKEAERLKKNGYNPLIVNKGKYVVLCVGNYKDKESARSVLVRLKKQYLDCFMRRL